MGLSAAVRRGTASWSHVRVVVIVVGEPPLLPQWGPARTGEGSGQEGRPQPGGGKGVGPDLEEGGAWLGGKWQCYAMMVLLGVENGDAI